MGSIDTTATKAKTLLAIPDKFRETALSFPAKVDAALALIDTPTQAKKMLDQAEVLAHYARRVKADTEIGNAIGYGKLKIVARLGELLPATPKEETGRGHRKSTAISGDTFQERTVSRYRRVSANAPKIDEYFERCKSNGDGEAEEITTSGFIRFATGTEKAGTSAHVSANTGVPEWYTPTEFIEAARAMLGTIELDPASSAIAQRTVRADKFFSIDDDGLSKPWAGNVWLNPPYTADLVDKFLDKLCAAFPADVPQAIVLINNATETKWFQRAAKVASAICFPAGRVKFLDEDGKPGAPLQGQAVLYFGGRSEKFIEQFRAFGFCGVIG